MTVDLRHNVVAGPEHGFQDIAARPDPDTLVRIPWDPTVAWCLADLERMDGTPYGVDSRGALRRAVAAFEALDLGLTPVMGPELEFYLAVPDDERAERLPPLRRQRQPRVHRGQRRRSAGRAARDAARVRRPGAGRVRRQPRVRPRAVRDQPPPLPRAGRRRPGLPVQGRGQGDVGPPRPAGDVHRQAVERRRGLRLPPSPVAGRRARQQRAGRAREGRAVPAGDALHRRPARARPGA